MKNRELFNLIYEAASELKLGESSNLSQEEKMDLWHNGTRKFNYKAANMAKLRRNLKICKDKGYKAEAAILRNEIKSRGAKVEESIYEYDSVENYIPIRGCKEYTGSYDLQDYEDGARGGIQFLKHKASGNIYIIATVIWSDKEYEEEASGLKCWDSIYHYPNFKTSDFKFIRYLRYSLNDLSDIIFKNTGKRYMPYEMWNWTEEDGNSILLKVVSKDNEKVAVEKLKKDNKADAENDEFNIMARADGYQDGLDDNKISTSDMRRNCSENGYDYEVYKKYYEIGYEEGSLYRKIEH